MAFDCVSHSADLKVLNAGVIIGETFLFFFAIIGLSIYITVMGTIMIIAYIAIGLVAAEHLYFMILEIFLWDKPLGLRSFGSTPEYARTTKVLAANQGLYNGFLAAGLVWGLILGSAGLPVTIFFLSCVIIAGVFGALTVRRTILFIQALPGAVALTLVLWSRMQ